MSAKKPRQFLSLHESLAPFLERPAYLENIAGRERSEVHECEISPPKNAK